MFSYRRPLLNRAIALLALSALGLGTGCMTVSDSVSVVQSSNSAQAFAGKKLALLPLKVQTSLTPDTVTGVRVEISKRLGQGVRGKLPGAVITDMASVSEQLNSRNALPVFEQLSLTYENTGVLDRQRVVALGQTLNADFLLLSRFKAEKLDIIISRSTGGSLDLSLVNTKTGEVAWAGSGEWKRGGIFGFGGTTADEMATGLVTQALATLN